MKKIFFSVYITLFSLAAFSQLLSSPIKIDNSLQKIVQHSNKSAFAGLPYGNINVLQQYPTAWQLNSINKTVSTNEKNINTDSLIGLLEETFYAVVNNGTRVNGAVNCLRNEFLFAPHFKVPASVRKHSNKMEIACIKLFTEKTFTTYSLTFSANVDCKNCEYIVKQQQNILINVDRENRLVDKLLIGNIEGNDLGRYRMYFYIDNKKIIHLKEFTSDELEDHFLNYEQYQILPDGSFTRYYPTNGMLKTNTEKGLVNNNKRDGKWIEKKQNDNLNMIKYKEFKDNYTWLEATYSNGVPIGQWNYYKLLQNYDEGGQAIISTSKKGKLIYTENYINGILKSKNFIKK